VEIGEVLAGSNGAVEWLHVRLELYQVARHETRRQPEMTQHLDEQPRRIPAGTARPFERDFARLHAWLHANQVADLPLDQLIQVHQKIDRAGTLGGEGGEECL